MSEEKYSFDISYELNSQTKNLDIKSELDVIIQDYPSIRWYASDCGPCALPYGNSVQEPVYINMGHLTNNILDIISVEQQIKSHPYLFVDFVSRDWNRIYNSSNSYANMWEEHQEEYNERVLALVDDEKILYDQLMQK